MKSKFYLLDWNYILLNSICGSKREKRTPLENAFVLGELIYHKTVVE